MSRYKLVLERDILRWQLNAYLVRTEGGKRERAEINWVEVPEGGPLNPTGPSFVVGLGERDFKGSSFLLNLKQELVELGMLEPSASTAEAVGELRASKEHLDDMRKLVFNNQPKGEVEA